MALNSRCSSKEGALLRVVNYSSTVLQHGAVRALHTLGSIDFLCVCRVHFKIAPTPATLHKNTPLVALYEQSEATMHSFAFQSFHLDQYTSLAFPMVLWRVRSEERQVNGTAAPRCTASMKGVSTKREGAAFE